MKEWMLKLVRYASVSLISTAVGLAVLGVLVASHALSPGWANVVATTVGTVPSFELNRRWVWTKRGRRSLSREIAPFCALSLGGLALSTLTVSVAAKAAVSAEWGSAAVTVVSEAAHVAAFGSLWIVQYLLLDRVLFASRRTRPTWPRCEVRTAGRVPRPPQRQHS